MATLVLAPLISSGLGTLFGAAGATAGLIGSSLGLAIAGGIGGFIDSYIANLISPRPDNLGRLDDLRITTGSEGAPMNFCVGSGVRVAGNIIWADDLEEESDDGDCFGDEPSLRYYARFAVGVCEGPIEAIDKIWANGKLIYDGGLVLIDNRVDDIRIYLGDMVQTPDAMIEDIEGAGNVPGYRGRAYIVFENLELTDFGQQIPNITCQVRATTTNTLAQAIELIWGRMKLSPTTIPDPDLTALSSLDIVYGYNLFGPVSTAEAIEPLGLAYSLLVQETEGVVAFAPRKASNAVSVPATDLAAYEFGTEVPRVAVFTDNPGRRLPDEVNVVFSEIANDYQTSTQRARRHVSLTRNVDTIQLPMAMTSGQARAVAERALYSTWAERTAVEIRLGPRWVCVQEGDLLAVPISGQTYSIRVTEVSVGWNLVVLVRGVVERAYTLTNPEKGSTPTGNPNGPIQAVTELTIHAMNLPPLSNDHVYEPGFYVAMCATDDAERFRGAELRLSLDGGLTYQRAGTYRREAVIGEADTELGLWDENTKDTTNTVTVTLLHGTLVSRTTAEVNAGKNWALLGDEIIAFETATLVSGKTYTLSNLYRGRKDTVDTAEIATHNIGERFVLLEPAALNFVGIDLETIGDSVTLRGIPKYGNAGSYPTFSFTPVGETLRNFRPRKLSRNTTIGATNDIIIEWDRKSRFHTTVVNGTTNPLDEREEKYELEIFNWNGDKGVSRRTAEVTGSRRFDYTTLLQAADGHTAGHPVYVEIRQIGEFLGAGAGNLGAGAVGPGYPGTIPGVRLHLVADNISQADNTDVASWLDKSGANNHATCSGTVKPKLRTGVMNGHKIVRFVGNVDEVLVTTLTTAFADCTVFAVFNASSPGFLFRRIVDKHYANGFAMMHNGNAADDQWGGGVIAPIAPYGSYVTVGISAARCLMLKRTGTTLKIRASNGNTTSAACSGTAMDTTAVRIANSNSPVAFDAFIGDIAEVLVFNRSLELHEEANIFAYFANKYGTA